MATSPGQQIAAANLAVVIVNYRTPELTMRCLAALRAEQERLPRLTAIVVDGGSDDGSAARLDERLRRSEYRSWVSLMPLAINGGFGWANNQAILTLAQAERPPEFIHLLNPDAEVTPGAVGSLVLELQRHPRCAAAGSQLLAADARPVASAFRFPAAGREMVNAAQSAKLGKAMGVAPTVISAQQSLEVDWVTGASVMLRTDALRETGLFDDGFFLYFEEVELMYRLRAKGWTVRHVPHSRVVHLEGAATGLGSGSSPAALPRYWYESRRRYFALTGGKAALLGANLGWFAGRTAGLGKRLFRGRVRDDGLRSVDLLRFGFWPHQGDQTPSIARLNDTAGKPPAWMARR
jgi:N-acetylglucosaminyl-diphospho-decaprenol L-rhamnosyltransferase